MEGSTVLNDEYTPMMQHYLATKEAYKDCILFYRLGDFYEMFFDDANNCIERIRTDLNRKKLRNGGTCPDVRCPISCSGRTYLNRAVAKKGYKVAICEQVEDPKACKGNRKTRGHP